MNLRCSRRACSTSRRRPARAEGRRRCCTAIALASGRAIRADLVMAATCAPWRRYGAGDRPSALVGRASPLSLLTSRRLLFGSLTCFSRSSVLHWRKSVGWGRPEPFTGSVWARAGGRPAVVQPLHHDRRGCSWSLWGEHHRALTRCAQDGGRAPPASIPLSRFFEVGRRAARRWRYRRGVARRRRLPAPG